MRKYFRGSSTKTNNEKVELDELLEAFNARNIVKNCWKHEHTGAEPNQTQSKLGLAVRHLKLKFDVWKVWNWRSLKLKEPKRIRSLKLNYETWHQNLKLKNWNLTMLSIFKNFLGASDHCRQISLDHLKWCNEKSYSGCLPINRPAGDYYKTNTAPNWDWSLGSSFKFLENI